MLSVTHLVVSVLLIELMALDRNDAFVALLFGVFIDLDHLIGLKNYTHTNGFSSLLDADTLMSPGGQWKSYLHNPIAIAIVAPASIASRIAAPLIFWGVHIGMDCAQEGVLGNFSALEAGLLAFSAMSLAAIRYSKFIEGAELTTLREYFKHELAFLRGIFKISGKAPASAS